MITYIPQWITQASLPDIMEGSPIATPLTAISVGSDVLDAGATELPLGLSAALVTGVKFNGTTSSYTSSGTSIFFSALPVRTTMEVETSTALIYDLIGGKLPKGLFVSPQGILTGTSLGIKDDQGELYTFTVRVSNGQTVRDRTFRILVFPIAQTAVWNMAGLPLETSDISYSSIPYRTLGEVRRGEAFSFSIDVSHPDGDVVDLGITGSNGIIVRALSYNTGLPPGLSLDGTTIDGVVQPNTPPGKYFFTLTVVAPSAPQPIPVMIEVLNLRTTTFKRPVKMQWVTVAGSLGGLKELQTSNLTLQARDPNGGSVNYSLLQGTGDLPPGLLLNPQTGDIEGQVLFVNANTTYSFTVRASSASIFADRTFSIDVKDVYQSENISEVSLKFQGRDRRLALKGYGDIIPPDWLYRSGDTNFGLVTEPYIHVARGLYPDSTLSLLDYREDILCTFGPHAVATIKNDKGDAIYEVLYRRIIDPMDQDPFGKDVRTDGLVISYRQSKTEQNIHPMSIWNMRYDLLVDYGTDNGDLLPEWMESDANVPGFKTAFAVAYLKPGYGAFALSEIASSQVTNNGHVVKFDRVLLSRITNSRMTLDGDSPQMLPIYVPAGVASVTTGRWTSLVTEIFTVDVLGTTGRTANLATFTSIDQSTTDMNIDAGTISFPTSSNNRMLYLFVTGTPPAGTQCSNAPVGTDLILGPFISGVELLMVDGTSIANTEFTTNTSTGVLVRNTSFTAGGEITLILGEATFDDQDGETETLFDYQAVPVGKYIKLTNEFTRRP